PKGQSYTDAIRVLNVGNAEVMVKAYISDFDFQVNGDILFPDAGTGRYPLADYIRLNPTSLQLEPGEERIVRFTITMPEDLTGEYHGIIFFQTQPKGVKSPAPGKQVLVSSRIGAGIYTAVKNTVIQSSEIPDIFFKQPNAAQDSNSQYVILFHNNGNMHLRPTGQLKIIDAAGKEVASTPVNENKTSVLRDSYRVFSGDFKKKFTFRDGSHKIVAQLDYGKEILETEKSVYLLNEGGIESFTAKLIPLTVDKMIKVVFSAVTTGIPPGQTNMNQKKVFRIKSVAGELQGELLVNNPMKVLTEKKVLSEEYSGEWTGKLKPGLYIGEFLIFIGQNQTIASFCLIDNTGNT
ncbi:MAG: DUF916 domain-containing protein, partial [Acidobacteria bacterium]|nr:DUF916 domain-containing protein [Acidobacteriota bacterium]